MAPPMQLPAAQLADAGDGSRGAPKGRPQHPALLAGYNVRPPWKVAGVDYAVGYPKGTALTDWESLTGSGISVNPSDHSVTLTGQSGATISNVDFSLHGGAILIIESSQNTTVTRCKFGGSSYKKILNAVIYADVYSPGLAVTYSVMDGGGKGLESTLVSVRAGGGTTTLEYNWFKNYSQHVIELVQDPGSAAFSVVYKYNLIERGAMTPLAHLNFLQFGSGTAGSVDVEHNTTYQVPEASGGEGFQFYFNDPSGASMGNAVLARNTMIATGGASGQAMSYVIHGGTVGTGTDDENYFDITAAYGAYYPGSMTGAQGWTSSGNFNMVTGEAIAPQ